MPQKKLKLSDYPTHAPVYGHNGLGVVVEDNDTDEDITDDEDDVESGGYLHTINSSTTRNINVDRWRRVRRVLSQAIRRRCGPLLVFTLAMLVAVGLVISFIGLSRVNSPWAEYGKKITHQDWWEPFFEQNYNSSIPSKSQQCKSTVQGMLVADDRGFHYLQFIFKKFSSGYVCDREYMDYSYPGCCLTTEFTNITRFNVSLTFLV